MSWSVHSTVDEPIELICAFVAHYLNLGASEIHLCLDRKNDEVMDVLASQDAVRVTVCDEHYWSRTVARRRPVGQADRQLINLRDAHTKSVHDWMLFCDADEFLCIDPRFQCLDQVLDMFDSDVVFYTFPVAERVYANGGKSNSIFDGMYRCRNQKVQELGPRIYGDDWIYFSRGLLQDGPGKSIFRTSVDLDVDIHIPRFAGRNASPRGNHDEMTALRNSFLVHYDGLTSLHWALKLVKWYKSMIDLLDGDVQRIGKRRTLGRNNQAKKLHSSRANPQALHQLCQLQFLSDRQILELKLIDGIVDIDLDLEVAARTMFREINLDYSRAAFDERLMRLNADFIRDSGFNF